MRNSAAFLTLMLFAPSAFADVLATGVADTLTIDDEFVVNLDESTAMAFLPDERFVVTERSGKLRLFNADGTEASSPGSLAVSNGNGEKGLLNVVVHPDFANTRTLYFYHTFSASGGDDNRVVSIQLDSDDKLIPSSMKIMVEGIEAPANHDGGGLFILNNHLYIGTGDTGNNSGAKPYDLVVSNYYPTCFTNLNGKLLRLNLDGSIPQDNPLVGKIASKCGSRDNAPTTTAAARGEIFAWGFRNAFRVWGDQQTGNLWVGNVGEVTFEMIHVVPPLGNQHSGWPFREGSQGFPKSECKKYNPNGADCVDPVYSCEQSDNKDNPTSNCPGSWGSHCDDPDVPNDCDSMTGGLILSGCEWPESLRGRYIFGDYSNRRIWTLPINSQRDDVIGERVDFATATGGPVEFVEHAGALYIVQYSGGKSYISKVTPKMSQASCAPSASSGTSSAPPADAGVVVEIDSGNSEPLSSQSVSSNPISSLPMSTSSSATPGASQSSEPVDEPNTTQDAGHSAGNVAPSPATSSSSSCSCELVGQNDSHSARLVLLGAALAAVAMRRRKAIRG